MTTTSDGKEEECLCEEGWVDASLDRIVAAPMVEVCVMITRRMTTVDEKEEIN